MKSFNIKKINSPTAILLLCSCVFLISCSKLKEEFLNKQHDPSIVIPQKIEDYQALLDNGTANANQAAWMNFTTSHRLGMAGADEFYLTDERFNSLSNFYIYEKNAYIWKEDIYDTQFGITQDDWFNGYKRILYTNLVLDGIDRIEPEEKNLAAWNNVKGSALFYRSLNFYDLAQQFCVPYQRQTANTDAGIVLRTSHDVTVKSTRSTVEQTYQRIIQDVELAIPLLPAHPKVKFRPSKAAAYALLARTYMQMSDFEKVVHYSNLVMETNKTLTDYNTLDLNSNITFPYNNDGGAANEEIFYFCNSYINIAGQTNVNISEELLESYHPDDLRLKAYFRPHTAGNILFKGSFSGNTSSLFTGFSTAEIWLMRAEAYARLKKTDLAMSDLNHLLRYRYDTDNFEDLTAPDDEHALKLILEHRRKELVFRGVRWSDLRRLNQEPQYAKTLVRIVNGIRYELLPKDPKYVWPIPPAEIDLSNIKQNPRK